MDLFFYGTLLDPDVRRLVLGREVPREALKPARVRGFRRVALQGLPYPGAVRDPAAAIEGLVLVEPSARDRARVSRYEGVDYRLVRAEAELPSGERRPVTFYVLKRRRGVTGPWDLARWQARDKAILLAQMNRERG
jgi:gamma-glutamylcyclotransferase (GGCT)/AIG2-like uncharacterized protein YtfP